ncbi:MAG: IS66 family insertion sequence element accessory protein TnpB [Bacteroidetes bacterium]|nr:IS66 family insertion sequence element accessory protein TnpB [Bacteroidota bacterium]
MLLPERNIRVWVYARPTDMRKSFDGLAALTKNVLLEDPISGHLFGFFNRKKTYIKVLFFDAGGYCLWAKRLEVGQFPISFQDREKDEISVSELRLIIEGLSQNNLKKSKRLKPK